MLRFLLQNLPSIFFIAPRFACQNQLLFFKGCGLLISFALEGNAVSLSKVNRLPKLEESRMNNVKAQMIIF